MSHDQHVARRQVIITNALGFHMRPATKFVRVADRYQSEIRINFHERSFNGRSILDLTCLAAEKGSILEIEATGPDCEQTLTALAELIDHAFYEDENGDELPGSPSFKPPPPPPPSSSSMEPAQESPS